MPTRTQTDVPLKRKESPEDLVAGDMRAIESPGLASIHSLFHAEHNRIARQILALNPGTEWLMGWLSMIKSNLYE